MNDLTLCFIEILDGHRMPYITHDSQHRFHHNQSFLSVLFDEICMSTEDMVYLVIYMKCGSREEMINALSCSSIVLSMDTCISRKHDFLSANFVAWSIDNSFLSLLGIQ